MKVFILFQKQFGEGNFGDLERRPDQLIGVFETEQAAIAAKLFVKEKKFKAQFGTAKQETFIICAEVQK